MSLLDPARPPSILPVNLIHVFGVGGTATSSPLLLFSGFDSLIQWLAKSGGAWDHPLLAVVND